MKPQIRGTTTLYFFKSAIIGKIKLVCFWHEEKELKSPNAKSEFLLNTNWYFLEGLKNVFGGQY
jgi:hypothetical protein